MFIIFKCIINIGQYWSSSTGYWLLEFVSLTCQCLLLVLTINNNVQAVTQTNRVSKYHSSCLYGEPSHFLDKKNINMLACNLSAPYRSVQKETYCHSALKVWLYVCRYNNRLQGLREGLTWCSVAGILFEPPYDTTEGSPQWRSGESHWTSAHP